ncbi:hypothetical protein D9M72_599010 [compost metagenome]
MHFTGRRKDNQSPRRARYLEVRAHLSLVMRDSLGHRLDIALPIHNGRRAAVCVERNGVHDTGTHPLRAFIQS